jgi:hypothetical protein
VADHEEVFRLAVEKVLKEPPDVVMAKMGLTDKSVKDEARLIVEKLAK